MWGYTRHPVEPDTDVLSEKEREVCATSVGNFLISAESSAKRASSTLPTFSIWLKRYTVQMG